MHAHGSEELRADDPKFHILFLFGFGSRTSLDGDIAIYVISRERWVNDGGGKTYSRHISHGREHGPHGSKASRYSFGSQARDIKIHSQQIMGLEPGRNADKRTERANQKPSAD